MKTSVATKSGGPNAAAPAPAERAPVAPKVQSFDIARSDETLSLAADLANFIKENKLSMPLHNREYVNVEGWQYAGSRLGIVPVVQAVVNLSTEHEIKYQAEVRLLNLRTDQIVGAGFAICSNRESGKKFNQEFAILSMAQTRAIGKAYRNVLAWIIRAAGYEPTPAEEMDYAAAPNGAAAHITPAPAPAAPVAAPAEAPAPMHVSAPPTPGNALRTRQAADEAAGVVYLHQLQKQLIITLLNHPVVQRSEKVSMLLNIHRATRERAETSLDRLINNIIGRNGALPTDLAKRREAARAAAWQAPVPPPPGRPDEARQAAADELRQLVQQQQQLLGLPEADRLLSLCENPATTTEQLRQQKAAAAQELAERPAA